MHSVGHPTSAGLACCTAGMPSSDDIKKRFISPQLRVELVLKISAFFFSKFASLLFVVVLYRSPFFSIAITEDVRSYLEGLDRVNGAVKL